MGIELQTVYSSILSSLGDSYPNLVGSFFTVYLSNGFPLIGTDSSLALFMYGDKGLTLLI